MMKSDAVSMPLFFTYHSPHTLLKAALILVTYEAMGVLVLSRSGFFVMQYLPSVVTRVYAVKNQYLVNKKVRLNQITVSVTDIQKAIYFYQLLGLQLIVQSPHYARFVVPGNGATFSIHITEKMIPAATVIYFETDEVDTMVAALKEKGLVFLTEPVMQSWLWYEAYLCDPDGNKICIYHAGKNRVHPPWRLKQ
jgi:catechol 2,3-dioxygenase-like lactoylglutathione lyase family enzyme